MTSQRRPPAAAPRTVLTAALALVALLLAACGGGGSSDGPEGSGDSEPKAGGHLRVLHVTSPSTLDPHAGTSGNDHHSLYPIFDRLINFDPQALTPEPGLAVSWDYPDETTLVLKLQEGVEFHDGTPFDAEAVKYNLERGKNAETSAIAGDLAAVEEVEVTGENEVTIHLSKPDASLLLLLADRAGMMVSPTAAKAAGEDLGLNPVGTGPFKFVELVQNDHLELEKNGDYWQDGLPYLDGVTIRYVTDGQAGNNALLANEADLKLEVQATDIKALESAPGITTDVGPSLFYQKAYMNLERPPFNDPDVRTAVNLAIDRQSFVDVVQFGYGQPAHQPVPPEHWAYQEDLEPWPYDPDAARELIEKAGLAGTEFTALVVDIPGFPRAAEVMQAALADVGLTMNIEVAEVTSSLARFFEEGEGEMLFAGSTGRPDPQVTMNANFSSTAYFKVGDVPDEMDDLLADTVASTDLEERAEAYGRLYRVIHDEALEVPTTFLPSAASYRDNVHGFTPTLIGKPDVSFLWVD